MNPEITYRAATCDDAEPILALSEILKAAGNDFNFSAAPPAMHPNALGRILAAEDARIIRYLALDGETVAAMACIAGNRDPSVHNSYNLTVTVAPAYRRRGIGRELVQQLVQLARQDNAQAVTLQIQGSNQVGKAFFQACGFRHVHTIPKFYMGDDVDYMSMKL